MEFPVYYEELLSPLDSTQALMLYGDIWNDEGPLARAELLCFSLAELQRFPDAVTTFRARLFAQVEN